MQLRTKENSLRGAGIGFAIASFLLLVGPPLSARMPAQTGTSQRSALPSAQAAPVQPPLNVDRDPVPSPDPDPPAQPADTTAPPVPLGSIGRGAGGKYTLREDAYEVRLNASVFDQSGRSIQSLGKDAFRVYEDGVPQTIASFRHEDLPV